MEKRLQGIVPALVTPFRGDERIDFNAWQIIIDTLIDSGVDGLAAAGGQGEFFSLSGEERTVALRFCVQASAGRAPVYGNVGCVTTRETVKLAQAAEAVGVDYIVVVTPYYLKPSAAELVEHYIEVCRAVHHPVLANNNPERTGVDLTPEMAARIAANCENFAGLKDSSGRVDRIRAYRNAVPDRKLAVFTGCDNLILAALEQGASGAFAACANIAPRLFAALYRAWQARDPGESARLQRLVDELFAVMALHTFPGVVKEAMQMAGLAAGPCRKPVGLMPAEAREKLAAVLAGFAKEGYLRRAKRGATA
ncbi:MAG: dihydrodipicolinate synthase family protein [Acidobacteriia bacterium]|nr:dihydrodipicolinate synthase family protein [Terriglobia bacterium]